MDTNIVHIRPRFRFEVDRPSESILAQVSDHIKKSKDKVIGKIVNDHVVLDIPLKDRHYWSPQLNMRVEENEEKPGQAIVRGLIGPRPTVWGLFVFIYSAIGILGLFGSLYGLSKYSLGTYTHFIWALPIAILIMLTAYLTSKYGERLGHDQVELLKQFIRDSINLT